MPNTRKKHLTLIPQKTRLMGYSIPSECGLTLLESITLKATDRETQIKALGALMKYQNINGLNLEEVLSNELDL